MKKTQEDVSGSQGLLDMTVVELRKAVKQDFQLIASFCNIILTDENTINALADFMHGRLQNVRHQEELRKQTELDLDAAKGYAE